MNHTQKEIDLMRNGDVSKIEHFVASDTPILVLNAIIYGTQIGHKSDSFIDGLVNQSKNGTYMLGYEIRQFAIAALDILNIKNLEVRTI